MARESMWGNVPKKGKDIKRPYDYLSEQAGILSSMYSYDLMGVVDQEILDSGKFLIKFNIIAPSMHPYKYTLLTVYHGIEIYPLLLRDFANNKDYNCENKEEFEQNLRETLSSPAVGDIIENILTLIKK